MGLGGDAGADRNPGGPRLVAVALLVVAGVLVAALSPSVGELVMADSLPGPTWVAFSTRVARLAGCTLA